MKDTTNGPSLTIALRSEVGEAFGNCAVDGCRELPTMRLLDHMQVRNLIWCTAHGEMVSRMVAERNYRDFIRELRRQGVTEEPAFTDQRLERLEDRRCCVPKCTEEIVSGSDIASPFKSPGFAWVCKEHYPALDSVVKRLNGPRLIREMSRGQESTSSPSPLVKNAQAEPKLSKADQARYDRIGAEFMKKLTNQALWIQFKKAEKARGVTKPAFRQSLNRIRKALGLPSSQELQKTR